jgi:hypothetical protein
MKQHSFILRQIKEMHPSIAWFAPVAALKSKKEVSDRDVAQPVLSGYPCYCTLFGSVLHLNCDMLFLEALKWVERMILADQQQQYVSKLFSPW